MKLWNSTGLFTKFQTHWTIKFNYEFIEIRTFEKRSNQGSVYEHKQNTETKKRNRINSIESNKTANLGVYLYKLNGNGFWSRLSSSGF